MLAPDGRREHVTAASGLACAGDYLYVIADDRRELAVFSGDGPGRLARFLPGDLPLDRAARKRLKPDLEAIAVVPGALFMLESGSREQRRGGVLWRIDERGALAGDPRRVDLSVLYTTLEEEIPDLNIEGAAVARERLLLFQRGNGRAGVNAVVELDLDAALAELEGGALSARPVIGFERHDLGEVDGVRLTFSDASAYGDSVVFTAVAEAGKSTYHDGAVVAAAVGVLGGELHPIEPMIKFEGVEVTRDGLLLVADPDDPDSPAPLFRADLPATL